MTTKRRNLSRLEGLLWFALVGLIGWVTLSGPITRYLSAETRLEIAQAQIANHQKALAQPRSVSEHLKFRSFVHPADAETRLNSGDIQSSLISIAKDHRTRLVDLRVLEDDTSVETLIAHRFRLDVEGDLIAILDVLKAIAIIGQPALVEELTVSPVGSQDRPDRRLKASFELSFWLEKVPS